MHICILMRVSNRCCVWYFGATESFCLIGLDMYFKRHVWKCAFYEVTKFCLSSDDRTPSHQGNWTVWYTEAYTSIQIPVPRLCGELPTKIRDCFRLPSTLLQQMWILVSKHCFQSSYHETELTPWFNLPVNKTNICVYCCCLLPLLLLSLVLCMSSSSIYRTVVCDGFAQGHVE